MITMEDAIDALYTAINSGLETQLAAIEASRSCTITRWKTLARYGDYGGQFPKLELIPGDIDIEYGDADAPIVEGIGLPTVNVFVSVAGPATTVEAQGDELSRYSEGIFDVINADNTLSSAVDWALVAGVEWADFAVALEDKRLVQSLRVEVQMKKHG